MPVIRLPNDLVDDCREFLAARGKEKRYPAEIIKACLAILLYGTPSLADGRAEEEYRQRSLLSIEGGKGAVEKGRVADWAASSNVFKSGGLLPEDRDKNKALEEEISKTLERAKAEEEIAIKDDLLSTGAEEDETPATIERDPSKPPWEGLETADLKEIKKLYPKHPLYTWMGNDKFKRLAVGIAFSQCPYSAHKSQIILTLAESLYKEFKEWKK